jgi:membrane protease YdiL (CAAX protease family)
MALTAALDGASLERTSDSGWRRFWVFYGLTTALSAAAWLPYGAQVAGLLHTHIPPIIPVIGQYSPTVAALVLIAHADGFSGLGRFLKRSFNPFVGMRWFVAACAIPLLMAATLVAWHAARGGYVPAWGSLAGWPERVAQFLLHPQDASGGASGANDTIQALAQWARQGAVAAGLVFFGIAFANGGLSEEAGWRGYALDGLLAGRRAIVAAIAVGFFWGLWHTGPSFWAGVLQARWTVFSIPIEYTLATIPLTVMMAWIFIHAKKSLLPGMFFHATYNATFFFLTQIWTPGHPVASILEWVGATYAAAFVVVILGRRTLLAQAVLA